MTWFDYVVLAVVGVSILLSLWHGLVRELLSLAAWVIAFFVAQLFAVDVAPMMPAALSNASLRLLAAFMLVFLFVLIAMTLLATLVSHLVKSVGLGFADRALGAVFGLVRGVAIVLLAVLLAGLTQIPRHPAWRDAMLSAPLEALADTVKVWLPYDLSKHINYR